MQGSYKSPNHFHLRLDVEEPVDTRSGCVHYKYISIGQSVLRHYSLRLDSLHGEQMFSEYRIRLRASNSPTLSSITRMTLGALVRKQQSARVSSVKTSWGLGSSFLYGMFLHNTSGIQMEMLNASPFVLELFSKEQPVCYAKVAVRAVFSRCQGACWWIYSSGTSEVRRPSLIVSHHTR